MQTGLASSGFAPSPLPEQLNILWKFKTNDSIEGTAAIVNGVVYVGSMDGNLYALNLADGKKKWQYKSGPIKAPIGVHDGKVYFGDCDGMFHGVEAASGKKVWTFETGGEIGSGANFTKDQILFGSGDETLYCLSKDGKPVWKFKVPGGPVLGSPALAGERTFVSGCDSSLHVIDTGKGTEMAAVDLGGQTGATVAVGGDQIFVGTMSNQFLAINWKKGEIVWRFEAKKRPDAFFSSAALTETLAIVGSRDKRVHALDRKTGDEGWSFPTGGKVDSSPVVVGKRVYAGSLDGNLYVLDVNKGTEIQKLPLGQGINKGILGSPAMGGQRLVIGTLDGTVYCLGNKEEP